MNYLVIDLEMCMVPKHYRGKQYNYAREIIQIGAVLLDEDYKQIGTIRQYVHPEHGVIDHFIEKLTGIQGNQVKKAPKFQEAMHHMLDWLGNREYRVLAWSGSDYAQFQHEISCKHLEDDRIHGFMNPEQWIDYQAVFGKRYDFKQPVSLEDALQYCDMEPDGRLHDGLDDALNTARIIEMLESDPDFQLIYPDKEVEVESGPLNTCLGDLFSGLNIRLA